MVGTFFFLFFLDNINELRYNESFILYIMLILIYYFLYSFCVFFFFEVFFFTTCVSIFFSFDAVQTDSTLVFKSVKSKFSPLLCQCTGVVFNDKYE